MEFINALTHHGSYVTVDQQSVTFDIVNSGGSDFTGGLPFQSTDGGIVTLADTQGPPIIGDETDSTNSTSDSATNDTWKGSAVFDAEYDEDLKIVIMSYDATDTVIQIESAEKVTGGIKVTFNATGDKAFTTNILLLFILSGGIAYESGVGVSKKYVDDAVKAAIKPVQDSLAGCWISFTDEEGNPTEEPYIHWMSDEDENPSGGNTGGGN